MRPGDIAHRSSIRKMADIGAGAAAARKEDAAIPVVTRHRPTSPRPQCGSHRRYPTRRCPRSRRLVGLRLRPSQCQARYLLQLQSEENVTAGKRRRNQITCGRQRLRRADLQRSGQAAGRRHRELVKKSGIKIRSGRQLQRSRKAPCRMRVEDRIFKQQAAQACDNHCHSRSCHSSRSLRTGCIRYRLFLRQRFFRQQQVGNERF